MAADGCAPQVGKLCGFPVAKMLITHQRRVRETRRTWRDGRLSAQVLTLFSWSAVHGRIAGGWAPAAARFEERHDSTSVRSTARIEPEACRGRRLGAPG